MIKVGGCMFCPNCGIQMKTNYCTHCGYMRNGQFIESNKAIDESLLSYYFGPRYDYYNRNNNWFVAGLLGPMYIFCHNYYLIGLLLFIIDLIIMMAVFILNHIIQIDKISYFLDILYFIINRFIWATIGNIIYLKITNCKLKRVMKKYPDNYKNIIQDDYRLDNMLTGLKYVVYGIISFITLIIVREFIFSYLTIS